MEWLPIDTCPRVLWDRYIVAWPDGSWGLMLWKENRRLVEAHKRGEMLAHQERYFGDLYEWDDYDLALPESAPDRWLPVTPPSPQTSR